MLKAQPSPNPFFDLSVRVLSPTLTLTLTCRVLAGCSHVLHVASPWPIVADASVIDTAVQGTLNVLRAAARTRGLRKVVLTSSCAAVNGGC